MVALTHRVPRRQYSLPMGNDRAAHNVQTNTMSKFLLIVVGIFILLVTGTALAQSVSLGSCQDDLDSLKHKASDASDAAASAKSKLDDLDQCRENPDIYDVFHDGCRNRRSDYESAIGDLQSSLDDVDTALHSVQSSCGYDFTLGKMTSVEAAQRSLCRSYRRLAALGVGANNAVQQCKPQMGEEWCKACLGLK